MSGGPIPTSELVLALGLLLLAWRLADALHSTGHPTRKASLTGFDGDDQANATLDFTLVFPLFAMVILVLVQLTLLINARLVVSYAAFAAARSAVVWTQQGKSVAQLRAEQAAALGCLPIASAELGRAASGPRTSAVGLLFSYERESSPELRRRQARAEAKYAYSRLATSVQIEHASPLGPHDPVTVEVAHRFYLSVPYGDRLFRDAGSSAYPVHTIRDRFTLTNEGHVRSP